MLNSSVILKCNCYFSSVPSWEDEKYYSFILISVYLNSGEFANLVVHFSYILLQMNFERNCFLNYHRIFQTKLAANSSFALQVLLHFFCNGDVPWEGSLHASCCCETQKTEHISCFLNNFWRYLFLEIIYWNRTVESWMYQNVLWYQAYILLFP